MNKVVTIYPPSFDNSLLPEAIRDIGGADELGAGVTGGFSVMSFRGKVWRVKFRGEEIPLLDENKRNPKPEIEVVIVKASSQISKVFYKDRYADGNISPPDCLSTNGIVPDAGAPDKQSPTCAGCKQNVWGSRVTDSGKKAKACSDNKRLVIVPADDMRNESYGGPMMLRIPPATLQDMKTFGDQMAAKGFPYYSFITRLRFDTNEAFPKIVFEAVRPLTNDEAKLVVELRDDPITQRILDAPMSEVHYDTDPTQPVVPAVSKEAEAAFSPEAAKVAEQIPPDEPKEEPKPEPVTQRVTPEPEGEVPPHRVVKRPKFDPETGEKIVYPDEQSFPEIPSGLKREKVKPVKAEPKTADVKVGGSFEAQLDGLLGNTKK